MEVLKNYKVLKERVAEFPKVHIRYDDSEVFLRLPICVVPYEKEHSEAYLIDIDPRTGFGKVVDRETVNLILSRTRIFHLAGGEVDGDGKLIPVKEVPLEEAITSVRLPLDVDLNTLEIREGQVYQLNITSTEETPGGGEGDGANLQS